MRPGRCLSIRSIWYHNTDVVWCCIEKSMARTYHGNMRARDDDSGSTNLRNNLCAHQVVQQSPATMGKVTGESVSCRSDRRSALTASGPAQPAPAVALTRFSGRDCVPVGHATAGPPSSDLQPVTYDRNHAIASAAISYA